jgi:hypothetical protein
MVEVLVGVNEGVEVKVAVKVRVGNLVGVEVTVMVGLNVTVAVGVGGALLTLIVVTSVLRLRIRIPPTTTRKMISALRYFGAVFLSINFFGPP